ncbi:hypothetical protein CRYUN_Cryun33cG0019700 [Craigia yunnanensis]
MAWCPFWIQIHGLPLGLMNEKIGIVLGEALGEVLEVETSNDQLAWGKWMRELDCNVSVSLQKDNKKAQCQYGPWLRAEELKFSTVQFEDKRLYSQSIVDGSKTQNEDMSVHMQGDRKRNKGKEYVADSSEPDGADKVVEG